METGQDMKAQAHAWGVPEMAGPRGAAGSGKQKESDLAQEEKGQGLGWFLMGTLGWEKKVCGREVRRGEGLWGHVPLGAHP